MSRLSNGSSMDETDQDISIKRASSTSSHYDNINANLHARVKAFQEQRALKRSASVGSSSTSSSKNNSSTNLNKHNNEDHSNDSSTNSNNMTTINDNELQDSNDSNTIQAIKNRSRSHLKTQSVIETRSMIHTSTNTQDTITDTNNNTSKNSIPNSQSKHVSIVNKPLPPLPPVSGTTVTTTTTTTANTTKITQSMNKLTLDNNSNLNNNINNKNNNDNKKITNTNSSNHNNNISIRRQPPITNKPINKMTINTNLNKQNPNIASVPQQFNPNRRAPRRPVIITGANNSAAQSRQPKQSLSARRGLKLPPGGMSLKNLTKGTSSSSSSNTNTTHEFEGSPTNEVGRRTHGSLINGVQRTSISSNDRTRGSNNEGSGSSSSGSGSGSGSGGLFSIFSKYVDIKSGSLNFAGKLSLSSTGIDFSNGSSSRITLDELEFIEELGHGNYGNVSKVLHKPTNVIMAMKEVKLELDEAKFKQILMELEILHKCQSPYIVDFYGAFFIEGAVYMCMEYMDGGSLDKIYDPSPEIGGIDEPQLAYITNAVIRGLKVLKDVHNIIHRDVKPTNILCSAKQGTIKLCDFGVSGNLVASMAKTNIGCQSYMAPERIKSLNPDIATYTVQSDIWSLGLSILEMALGRYPYPPETFDNIFSQLSAIVDGPAPKLPSDRFSPEAQDFVSLCLQKIPERRPNYAALIEHPWLVRYRDVDVGMSNYITTRLQKRKEILAERGENGLPKVVPALHMGGLP